ncbi:MAG: hypothetical protein ACXWPS_06225, partial [Ktedonobacteraceae bacterium]
FTTASLFRLVEHRPASGLGLNFLYRRWLGCLACPPSRPHPFSQTRFSSPVGGFRVMKRSRYVIM